MAITVNSTAELIEALNAAQGGEVIELAAGDYGALDLRGRDDGTYRFDAPVTIRSASENPQEQAVFSGMKLNGVEGLNIENVTFDYDADVGVATNDKASIITGSQNVSVKDSTFIGDLAEGVGATSDGYATGIGLHVDSSNNVEVSGNDFSSFLRGATFWRSDNLVVTGNHVYEMRSDGFNFADVDDVLIEGNLFENFIAAPDSGDHRDFIQFWTTSTTSPSTNVTIRGNVLDSGEGDWTQSIFIRNEVVDRGDAGQEMYYANFLIEDNVIRNGQQHGITMGQVDGLVIRNNTLIESQGGNTAGTTPRITVNPDGLNVTITQNVVSEIFAPSGAIVAENLIVDSDDFNALQDLFANALDPTVPALDALLMLDNGQQVGAQMLYRADEGETVVLLNQESGTGINLSSVTLSIQDFLDSNGSIGVDGIAQVTWNLGDGTQIIGNQVQYDYAAGGLYNVTAVVEMNSGEIINGQRLIQVESPIVHLEQFDSANALSAYDIIGSAVLEEGAGLALEGGALRVGTDDSYRGNTAYTISADFRLDEGDTGGRLINFTGSFHLQVQDGKLIAAVITDQGVEWIQVGNVTPEDGAWHRLTLTFSSDEGVATLMLDGEQVGQIDGLEGATQTGSLGQDFFIGNPSGGFSGNVDNVVFLRDVVEPEMLEAIVQEGSGAFIDNSGRILTEAEVTPAPEAEVTPAPEAEVTPAPEAEVTPAHEAGPLTSSELEAIHSLEAQVTSHKLTKRSMEIGDGENGTAEESAPTVTSTKALLMALKAATGGETILVESGTYDRVVLRNLPEFTDKVTIRSADVDEPAEITFLYIDGVSDVAFDTVTFGGTNTGKMPVQVYDSSLIEFTNVLFEGQGLEDRSVGMMIKDSIGVSVNESTFDGYDRAVLVRASVEVEITSNTISQTSRDAVSVIDSVDLAITNNVFDEILSDRGQSLVRIDNASISDEPGDVLIANNVMDAAGHARVKDITFDSAPEDSAQKTVVLENKFLIGQTASERMSGQPEAPSRIWELNDDGNVEDFIFNIASYENRHDDLSDTKANEAHEADIPLPLQEIIPDQDSSGLM